MSLLLVRSINSTIAAALATELLNPASLGRGLSGISSATRVAGIAGFAAAGYLFETMGAVLLCLTAAVIAISAAGLVGLLSGQGLLPRAAPADSR